MDRARAVGPDRPASRATRFARRASRPPGHVGAAGRLGHRQCAGTAPARAGSLVRAMALRADLAERVGDHAVAARWAAAVAAFWSDADPFLQPLVRRMRRRAG